MRGRFNAALVTGALVATIGSGVALALPVAAASRVAAPSRTPAEPLSHKMGSVQQQLTTGRASRAGATLPLLASSAPCNSNWSAVSSPNMNAGRNLLTGVAAIAPNDVWAVGTFVNGSLVYQTLAEHWDGSTWSVVPTPNVGPGNNLFNAVFAIGAADVWAVGLWRPGNSTTGAQPLTEHWNGNGWTIIPTPPAPNTSTPLYGVGASGSNDVWTTGITIDYPIQPTGPRAHAYALHWNGSNWSSAPMPSVVAPFGGPGVDVMGLSGVKVISPTDAWAVGDGQHYSGSTPASPGMAFIEHWDGVTWTQSQPPPPTHPNGDFLVDIQGTVGDLWAVGGKNVMYQSASDYALSEHWNGATWTEVALPPPSPAAESANLYALSYVTGSNVYAVGATASYPGTAQELDQPLIEEWNGSVWSQVIGPPAPSGNDGLNSVAALSASDVWSVGFMTVNGYAQTLTENYCAPPTVTNVMPSTGSAGTSVVITGTRFSRAIDVEFGATPAFSFHVDSDTQITAVSPGHKAGTVDITVTVQGTSATSSADQFTYVGSISGTAPGGSGVFQPRTSYPPPVRLPPPSPTAAPRHFAAASRSAPIPV